jgi:hypothetical protein
LSAYPELKPCGPTILVDTLALLLFKFGSGVAVTTTAPALVVRESPFGKQQTTSMTVAVIVLPAGRVPPGAEQNEASLHVIETGLN